MQELELEGLRVRLTGGDDGRGGGEGPMIVLLHGYGAPGDDLVPLAAALRAPAHTRFVFPAAPIRLAGAFAYGDSRAWWHLDEAALERAMRTGRPRDLRGELPAELPEARARVLALLDALDAPPATVLGGFSQGAMLSCDVALHSERPLAGLVMLSGNYLSERSWAPRMAARAGLRALQSHGRGDSLLGIDGATSLRDALVAAGWRLDWVEFDGGHEIPPAVVSALEQFLSEALSAGT